MVIAVTPLKIWARRGTKYGFYISNQDMGSCISKILDFIMGSSLAYNIKCKQKTQLKRTELRLYGQHELVCM
jgi:hypothetical protein